MEELLVNAVGRASRVSRGGREYLVAPMTLIVPGVLSGSMGPLYYSPEEVGRDPSLWDGVPMVVGHPVRNGSPVSARDPDVSLESEVGRVYRSAVKNGNLAAEGWFDVAATRRLSPDVLRRLEAGEAVELSTGLGLDREPAPQGSAHNGTVYTHIAKNFRPDHLAVLPDGVGACSVRDGCGVLVNVSDRESARYDERWTAQRTSRLPDSDFAGRGRTLPVDAVPDLVVVANRLAGQKLPLAPLLRIAERKGLALPDSLRTATNAYNGQPSHAEIRDQLCEQLRASFTQDQPEAYVYDVYDGFFIYSQGGDLYRRDWAMADGEARATGDAVEVEREVTFTPVEATTTTTTENTMTEQEKKKAETVGWITANCDCWKDPSDEATLNGFTQEKLDKLRANIEKSKVAPTPIPAVPTPVANAAADTRPLSERLSPDELRVWNHAAEVEKRERAALVQRLVANAIPERRDALTQQLMAKPTAELQLALELAPPPAPAASWFGAAGGPTLADNERLEVLDLEAARKTYEAKSA